MRQITVMSGPERRRRWSDEQRLQILAEACAPGACVADVARRHDISTARIYCEHFRCGITSFGGSGVEGVAVIPPGARVWIAMGHTDMRKGMQGLALQVQQGLGRDPHGGDLFVFRGRAGSLVKIIWHDGIAMSLYARRLEKGRFIWPSAKDGAVSLTNSQLACLLDGIDWRNPQYSWRPQSAG